MMPWFIWKGIDSRQFGLWVSELPSPRKAAERVGEVVIPGMAGTLHTKEGDGVHDGYVKECRITAASNADFASIITWLSGSSDVVFSNEPDKAYEAEIVGEIIFTRDGNSFKKAMIPFYVHPHKKQYPPESAVQFQADGTLYNPGTVAAKPLVQVTFTSTCTVTVNDMQMTFTAKPLLPPPQNTIYVDCDAQLITDDDGIWDGSSSGDFWVLEPGQNSIALTDAQVTVRPRWRWY